MWHSKGEGIERKTWHPDAVTVNLVAGPDFVTKGPSFPEFLCFSANQAEQALVHIILLCVWSFKSRCVYFRFWVVFHVVASHDCSDKTQLIY